MTRAKKPTRVLPLRQPAAADLTEAQLHARVLELPDRRRAPEDEASIEELAAVLALPWATQEPRAAAPAGRITRRPAVAAMSRRLSFAQAHLDDLLFGLAAALRAAGDGRWPGDWWRIAELGRKALLKDAPPRGAGRDTDDDRDRAQGLRGDAPARLHERDDAGGGGVGLGARRGGAGGELPERQLPRGEGLSADRPYTHRTADPRAQQYAWCKCARCEGVHLCTPDRDFFGEEDQPLLCNDCSGPYGANNLPKRMPAPAGGGP